MKRKFSVFYRVAALCMFGMMFLLTACGDQRETIFKGEWLTSLKFGQEAALSMERPLLIYVTDAPGQIADSRQFTEFAAKNIVLVNIDLTQSAKWKSEDKLSNEAFLKQYELTKFPAGILLTYDSQNVLTMLETNPAESMDQLISSIQRYSSAAKINMKPATDEELNELFWFVPDPIATVNGVIVPKSEIIKEYSAKGFPLELLKNEGLDLRAMVQDSADMLIESEILLQMAAKSGIQPSAGLVKDQLEKAYTVMTDEEKEKAEKQLELQGETFEEFNKRTAEAPEIQRAAAIQLFVNRDYLEKAEAAVTDAEVLKFYNDNKATRFTIPEYITVAHILAEIQPGAPESAEKEAEKRINKIYEALMKDSTRFPELAQNESDCPSGKRNNGKLPSFAEDGTLIGAGANGTMDEVFAKEAFKLQKPGQISKPVKTDFGWHIIKLLERKEPYTVPLDDTGKKSIHQELASDKANQSLAADIEAIRKSEKVVVTPFLTEKPAAKPEKAKD